MTTDKNTGRVKVFVYFNPETWELVIRSEFGSTFYSEWDLDGRYTVTGMWNEWAEKTYIRVGEYELSPVRLMTSHAEPLRADRMEG